MRIRDVRTYLVGNAWKNWLFVRVETDEGIHGVGEGTLNAFSATVETAIHELRDDVPRARPEPGRAAPPADRPRRLHRRRPDPHGRGRRDRDGLLGHRRQGDREAGPRAPRRPGPRPGPGLRQRLVPDRPHAGGLRRAGPGGRRARLQRPEVRSVRGRLAGPGPARGGPVDRDRGRRARRGRAGRRPDDRGPQPVHAPSTALRIADRLAEHRPAWLEEPVHHAHLGAMVEVARRSPVPIATGESFTSAAQFADLMAHDAVHIFQPEPLHLGGLWRTRQVAAMADAHLAVVAPHNAGGPVCSAVSAQLGGCIPNFYVQESFDEFNSPWTREIVDRPIVQRDGFVEVPTAPGLGIDLDWDRLAAHPVPARAPAPPLRAGLGATRRRPDAGRRRPGRGGRPGGPLTGEPGRPGGRDPRRVPRLVRRVRAGTAGGGRDVPRLPGRRRGERRRRAGPARAAGRVRRAGRRRRARDADPPRPPRRGGRRHRAGRRRGGTDRGDDPRAARPRTGGGLLRPGRLGGLAPGARATSAPPRRGATSPPPAGST